MADGEALLNVMNKLMTGNNVEEPPCSLREFKVRTK